MKWVRFAIAVMAFAVVFTWIGCQRDDRPLHERIADAMYHDHFDPRWEHLVERYGEEDFTVDPEDTAGGIYSERFDMWVKLEWFPKEKTYKDNYIVYLRQGEMIELLESAFAEVLDESPHALYVLPYLFCPTSYNRDTTALELLDPSEVTGDILVQTAIFLTKDPGEREADLRAIQEAVQSRGWSLQVALFYIPEEHLSLISENKRGDPYDSMAVTNKEFYFYRAVAHIRPDSFDWSVIHGWRKGEA